MPAEAIHLTSLGEGLALASLPSGARRILARSAHAARLGALFVDLPYFDAFERELVRYVARRPPRASPWGSRTHEHAVKILRAVVARAAALPAGLRRDEARAFALGLASHLAIDQAAHPLVNWLAEKDVATSGGKLTQAMAHREVEKFQSICFHEAYFGADMMGTTILASHLDVRGMERLEESAGASVGLAAMRDVLGGAPSPRELGRWGRSYMRYTRILASPIGKTIAPPKAKDAARPRYLEGTWGTFDAILERAIARSAPVLEGVWATLDEPSTPLRLALDEGTIDPPGSTFTPP